MHKLKHLIAGAALVPFALIPFAGSAHASGHDLTAQQIAQEGQAARLDLIAHGIKGPALGGTWVCTSETWWSDSDGVGYVQPHSDLIEGADDTLMDDTYELCGWNDASADQFAIYDASKSKYAGVDETGNKPVAAVYSGGDSRAFFKLAEIGGTGYCDMNFYNVTDNLVYTGSSPGYALLGGSSANYSFDFGAFPDPPAEHC